MTARRRILENATDVFHSYALLDRGVVTNILTASEEGKKHCLKQLFNDLSSHLFKPRVNHALDDPPKEMLQDVTFENLWGQYNRFRHLAARLVQGNKKGRAVAVEVDFGGSESRIKVVPLSSVVAAGSGQTRKKTVDAIRAIMDGRHDAEVHLVGARVAIARKHKTVAESSVMDFANSGSIVKIVRALSDADLYEAVMTCCYEVIQLHSVWHIVLMYHHCCMRCFCTQTMCETANSSLRMIERRNAVGRPLSVKPLVESTRLRCAGVRGNMTDVALLWRGLCRHFGVPLNTGDMHFFRRRKYKEPRNGLVCEFAASSFAIASTRRSAWRELQGRQFFLTDPQRYPVSRQRLADIRYAFLVGQIKHVTPQVPNVRSHMKACHVAAHSRVTRRAFV